MIKNCITALLLTAFFVAACDKKRDYSFLEKAGIQSADWKKDTFGCLSYRYNKTDTLLKCKQQLLTLKEGEFLSFFGEPNLKRTLNDNREILFYINEPNLYCDGKLAKEYIFKSAATSLYFVFDKEGKMLELGMKIP